MYAKTVKVGSKTVQNKINIWGLTSLAIFSKLVLNDNSSVFCVFTLIISITIDSFFILLCTPFLYSFLTDLEYSNFPHKHCNKCHKDFMVSNLNLLLTHFGFHGLCICLAGVYIAISFSLTRLNRLYLPTILLSWSCLFRKFTFFCLEMSVNLNQYQVVEGVFINCNFMTGKNYYNFSET